MHCCKKLRTRRSDEAAPVHGRTCPCGPIRRLRKIVLAAHAWRSAGCAGRPKRPGCRTTHAVQENEGQTPDDVPWRCGFGSRAATCSGQSFLLPPTASSVFCRLPDDAGLPLVRRRLPSESGCADYPPALRTRTPWAAPASILNLSIVWIARSSRRRLPRASFRKERASSTRTQTAQGRRARRPVCATGPAGGKLRFRYIDRSGCAPTSAAKPRQTRHKEFSRDFPQPSLKRPDAISVQVCIAPNREMFQLRNTNALRTAISARRETIFPSPGIFKCLMNPAPVCIGGRFFLTMNGRARPESKHASMSGKNHNTGSGRIDIAAPTAGGASCT